MARTGQARRLTDAQWNRAVRLGAARAMTMRSTIARVNAELLRKFAARSAARLLEAQGYVAAPTDWTVPHDADQLFPEAWSAELEQANRDLREALLHASLGELAAELGVRFDLKNPLMAGVLEQAGQHITGVTETQRLEIMRLLNLSWEAGESVRQAAQRLLSESTIRAMTRAQMIARTEIIGTSNGASLAAARGWGVMKFKVWMTASGARHPRHSDYLGLDGQTKQLAEPFMVGGYPLDYPGDSSGPAGEIINCRCTVSYKEKAS